MLRCWVAEMPDCMICYAEEKSLLQSFWEKQENWLWFQPHSFHARKWFNLVVKQESKTCAVHWILFPILIIDYRNLLPFSSNINMKNKTLFSVSDTTRKKTEENSWRFESFEFLANFYGQEIFYSEKSIVQLCRMITGMDDCNSVRCLRGCCFLNIIAIIQK